MRPAHIAAALAKRLPPELRRRTSWRIQRLIRPAQLGLLSRTSPLSAHWGHDRGIPIDRHYIEHFLTVHRADLRGHALEVKDARYTGQPGLPIKHRDVLDIDSENSAATIIADLAAADEIPAERFDCFVLTQTLQFIPDVCAAIGHAYRILRPGGVLLATVPSVSRIDGKSGLKHDYWRFTAASCAMLFGDVFGDANVTVSSYGNVLTAVAFLEGMAVDELPTRAFAENDPYFPVLVAVRARKGG
jgi:SAM-dependent methyltransferase